MKLKCYLIFLFSLIVIASCKKDVEVTIPTILTNPIQPGTFDTVRQSVVASASVDNNAFRADSVQWKVLDDANNQLAIIHTASDTVIRWVPQREGDYRIVATVFYHNSSATANVQVHVQNTPASVQKQMIGKWKGTVTTRWIPPYQVQVEFFSNGQYSARNMDPTGSPALYYGTDADSPTKTYEVISLDAKGGNGNIVVLFDIGTTTLDQLKAIKLSNNNNSLTFELWHFNEYGPVSFDLTRL